MTPDSSVLDPAATESTASARRTFFERCPLCSDADSAAVAAFDEVVFVSCRGCGLVYKREQIPAPEQQYEASYFTRTGPSYLRRWRHRVRKSLQRVRLMLARTPHARDLLDVGCSTGYVLEAAAGLGLSAWGIDVSEFAVQHCEQRGYRVRRGDLTKLPFPAQSFDIVIARHTLEHADAPLQALGEIRRVLRPGGSALIAVPDAEYWKRYLMPRRGRYFRPDRSGLRHHVYFSERTLVAAIERAGLVVAGRSTAAGSPGAAGQGSAGRAHRGAAETVARAVMGTLHLRREVQLVAYRPTEP